MVKRKACWLQRRGADRWEWSPQSRWAWCFHGVLQLHPARCSLAVRCICLPTCRRGSIPLVSFRHFSTLGQIARKIDLQQTRRRSREKFETIFSELQTGALLGMKVESKIEGQKRAPMKFNFYTFTLLFNEAFVNFVQEETAPFLCDASRK